MALPLAPPIAPMLAQPREEVPEGEGWRYEPKWDGFRAVIFRDGDALAISSRNGQPLQRYFPELVASLKAALPAEIVIDGEIIIAGEGALDFDALSQRIHPAASRIERLAKETPASFVAFDLLALGAKDYRALPFDDRRVALKEAIRFGGPVLLTPQTDDVEVARKWFVRFEGAGLDGIVAKRAERPYVEGERVMVKIKHERTADCVVGGYRVHKNGGVGSLLLGLYDADGVLHHIGHTAAFSVKQRRELLELLQPLTGGESFGAGRTPGGPSRWSQGRDMSWTSVTPTLVCEVTFDHLQGDRFRHAAKFVRWRPDKTPRECDFSQLEPPYPFRLEDLPNATG